MGDILDSKAFDPAERVIVALDCDMDRAIELADMLEGQARWLKLGMSLFYLEGPRAVAVFKERGFKVFLDLKLHDIPHQVRGAARSIAATGADMITVHASGGAAMIQAAIEGVAEGAEQAGFEKPAVLAVTVLTSMDDVTLNSIGVSDLASTQVKRLASLAVDAGACGVVASPQEAEMLRSLLGPDKLIVTPGIRPAGSDVGDQARIASPAHAFAAGSSHIVVGRPITQTKDPSKALSSIIAEIQAS